MNKKNGSNLTKWTYWEEFRKISEIWQGRVKISKDESLIPSPATVSPEDLVAVNSILPEIQQLPQQPPKPVPIQFRENPPESPPAQQPKRIKLSNTSKCEKLVQTEEVQNESNLEQNEIRESLKRIEETNLMFLKRMEDRDNQILNVLNNISVSCQKIAESLLKK